MYTMKKFAKTMLVATLALLPVLEAEASVSVHSHSLKSIGFLSQISAISNEIISTRSDKKSENAFFNTTELASSKAGAVKTYTIKVVKSSEKKKKSFKADYIVDNSATRFLIRPVAGVLTSAYGRRVHPKRKRVHFHSGIDLAAKSGTPIACAGAGIITFAGWKGGYGYCIMVDHGNGYETLYGHCSKLNAKEGQVVSTGKTIAYVGRTGVATGPHLHFEVRKNGSYQNPMRYFKN